MRKEDIAKIINENYRDYEGYVQFSNRPIDKEKDIFTGAKKVEIVDESGFIYEAHFCNGSESVMIRQINDSWLISTTDISNIASKDTEKYISDIKDFSYKIKMAQIWEEENDPFCENIPTLKLKKVVFVGFAKGDDK